MLAIMRGWEPVTSGRSGALVHRSPDGQTYAKTAVTPSTVVALEAERDRLIWLGTTPVHAPRVVDWYVRDGTRTLVSSALPGVPAGDLAAAHSARAAQGLVAFLALLHSLATGECPFDQRLSVTIPSATANVAAGRVDETDFYQLRGGRSPHHLLEQLAADRPRAQALEAGDLAVCHGDFCLPNVLLDPGSLTVTGVLDVGHLGLADRHHDIALLTRSMAAPFNPGYGPDLAARVLTETDADPWRIEYYRLLDEFF